MKTLATIVQKSGNHWWLTSYWLFTAWDCLAQGYLVHQVTQLESQRVYLLSDACEPDGDRTVVTGRGYTAMVYYTLGDADAPDQLRPLQEMVGWFSSGGAMVFPFLRFAVPHGFGDDPVTVQVRVWDNRGETVVTWEQALADPTIAQGSSPLMRNTLRLFGTRRDGTIALGNPNIYHLRPSFVIAEVCPEPSSYGLVGLACGLWWILRGPRSR